MRGNKLFLFFGLALSYLLGPTWLILVYYEMYGSLSGLYTLFVDTTLLWPRTVVSVVLSTGNLLFLLPIAVTGLIMYSVYREYKPARR